MLPTFLLGQKLRKIGEDNGDGPSNPGGHCKNSALENGHIPDRSQPYKPVLGGTLSYILKALSLNIVMAELRASAYEFGGTQFSLHRPKGLL